MPVAATTATRSTATPVAHGQIEEHGAPRIPPRRSSRVLRSRRLSRMTASSLLGLCAATSRRRADLAASAGSEAGTGAATTSSVRVSRCASGWFGSRSVMTAPRVAWSSRPVPGGDRDGRRGCPQDVAPNVDRPADLAGPASCRVSRRRARGRRATWRARTPGLSRQAARRAADVLAQRITNRPSRSGATRATSREGAGARRVEEHRHRSAGDRRPPTQLPGTAAAGTAAVRAHGRLGHGARHAHRAPGAYRFRCRVERGDPRGTQIADLRAAARRTRPPLRATSWPTAHGVRPCRPERRHPGAVCADGAAARTATASRW